MDFILALGALVAVFWTGVIVLRGGMLAGSLLVLLAGSCFGHPFWNLPAGPLPLTLDRLLLAGLLAQTLLYRHWGWTERKPLTRSDYLLGAFLCALTASALTHDFRVGSGQPLAQLALFFFLPAAMYCVARQTKLSERGARWLFGALATFGVYLCVTAIAETQQAWALVFPGYIASAEFHEFFGRGRGPFLNPAAMGIVQGLGLCAALVVWPRFGRKGKLALLALVPLFIYGTFCTFTRSAWMGAALGGLVVTVLNTPRQWRVGVAGGMLLLAVVGAAASWEHVLAFKRDRDLSAEDAAESARLRPILAVVAWHMFLDRPLLGCGFGQYTRESPAYLSDRSTELPLEKARPYVQHNVFLGLLTETGLIGMGLFVALLLSWTRTAWQLWRRDDTPWWVQQTGLLFLAFLGVYLPNAMFQDVSIIPMVSMFLFFLAGTVASLTPWLAERPPAPLRLWKPEPEISLT